MADGFVKINLSPLSSQRIQRESYFINWFKGRGDFQSFLCSSEESPILLLRIVRANGLFPR